MRARTVALGTLIGAGLLALAGAGAFVHSGIYDIAAQRPHLAVVRRLFGVVQVQSVRRHARGIEVPPLDDPAKVRRGLVSFRERCVVCHGAPGEARARTGVGLNPNPPPLSTAAAEWTDAELYWIIANGLKMAGMPAYSLGEEPDDLWALVAFTRRLTSLAPGEYRRMVNAVEGRSDTAGIRWVAPERGGALPSGDPERGRILARSRGCNACHVVPGVPGRRGTVGPPLTRWSERHYIAGALLNTPDALVRFLLDPQAVEPGTAMPDVGLTRAEALHIAAYLFTLE